MSRKKNIKSYTSKKLLGNKTKTIKNKVLLKSRNKSIKEIKLKGNGILDQKSYSKENIPGYNEISNLLNQLSSKSFLSREIKKMNLYIKMKLRF